MHILIADDHAIVRHGAMLFINEWLPGAKVWEADNFNKVVKTLEELTFDLLILDINIPGGNNIQMIDVARLKQPGIRILIFTAYDEQLYAIRYLQAGANGYLHKLASEDQIKNAIETVLADEQYMSREVKESLLRMIVSNGKKTTQSNPLNTLSNREIEVARFLVQGLTLMEISKALHLQISTVSTYKNRIFEKLEINNLVELVEKVRLYDKSII
ncbi:two component transcriptional regulator, LuxR family [Filimonas lacunae]|uniref:Two component transcriptional regulator, LuxR family n=1 Tax=Filimonas lacunae TaxID=477680 RepID=A0A173MKK6_9BACT|nr:response regulator transcription factor [Filimonas lacunae]BAV08020.1 DNA-binding response regulator, LuxR family [Filimonas lacunae]SIT08082.1 two component transcriptional regulator, LuxR family [Filimonas lacunae]